MRGWGHCSLRCCRILQYFFWCMPLRYFYGWRSTSPQDSAEAFGCANRCKRSNASCPEQETNTDKQVGGKTASDLFYSAQFAASLEISVNKFAARVSKKVSTKFRIRCILTHAVSHRCWLLFLSVSANTGCVFLCLETIFPNAYAGNKLCPSE